MTFGYNSGVAFSQSVAGVSVFANDLLDRLRGLRRHANVNVRSLTAPISCANAVLSRNQPDQLFSYAIAWEVLFAKGYANHEITLVMVMLILSQFWSRSSFPMSSLCIRTS